jgi:hypothetical protein
MARAIFSFGVLLFSAICWSPVQEVHGQASLLIPGSTAEGEHDLNDLDPQGDEKMNESSNFDLDSVEDNKGVLGEPIIMYEENQANEDSTSSKNSVKDNKGILGEPIIMYEENQANEDSTSSESSSSVDTEDYSDMSDVEENSELHDINGAEQNSGVLGEPITLYKGDATIEENRDTSIPVSDSPIKTEDSEQVNSILGDPITVSSSDDQQLIELNDFSEGVLSPNGEDAYALSSDDIPAL